MRSWYFRLRSQEEEIVQYVLQNVKKPEHLSDEDWEIIVHSIIESSLIEGYISIVKPSFVKKIMKSIKSVDADRIVHAISGKFNELYEAIKDYLKNKNYEFEEKEEENKIYFFVRW